jgi:DNA invertase Pin-like site-specific DNA recombinase
MTKGPPTTSLIEKRYDARSDEGMHLFLQIVTAIAAREGSIKKARSKLQNKGARVELANDIMRLIAEPKP